MASLTSLSAAFSITSGGTDAACTRADKSAIVPAIHLDVGERVWPARAKSLDWERKEGSVPWTAQYALEEV